MQRITMKLSMDETVNLSNLGNRLGFLTVSLPLERDSGTTGMLNFSVRNIISFLPNCSDILCLFLPSRKNAFCFIHHMQKYASLTLEDR